MKNRNKKRLALIKRQTGRVPLPRQVEKVHSTKSGVRGYRRSRRKQAIREAIRGDNI
jgi:hypothetical protein